jgi:hypothetical protein
MVRSLGLAYEEFLQCAENVSFISECECDTCPFRFNDNSLKLSVSVKVQNYFFFWTTSPWKREEWDGWSLCRALCRPVTACRGFQRTALPKHRRRLDRENKTKTKFFYHTSNVLYRKCDTNIPKNETAHTRPNF